MSKLENETLEFVRKKSYKNIKLLGRGGLGETRLIFDDIINEHFVCKKYIPEEETYKEKYFENFKDEIKLLHLASHKNIVRVFNYYLYPEHFTGYILMEFVEGLSIDEYCKLNPENISAVFEQVIDGFRHLEQLKILHRDIRPGNILVTKEGIVKVIDFGFGKKVDFQESGFSNSIMSINWRYSPPDEFDDDVYDFSSDIYFIGKMFQDLIQQNAITTFKYSNLVGSMILAHLNRPKSFEDVYRSILTNNNSELDFNLLQKKKYLIFADHLTKMISSIRPNPEYYKDVDSILVKLNQFYKTTVLEDNLQQPNNLIKCFINGSYKFYPKYQFPVDALKKFIELYSELSSLKRLVVINNLWNRFDSLIKSEIDIDDLPF